MAKQQQKKKHTREDTSEATVIHFFPHNTMTKQNNFSDKFLLTEKYSSSYLRVKTKLEFFSLCSEKEVQVSSLEQK